MIKTYGRAKVLEFLKNGAYIQFDNISARLRIKYANVDGFAGTLRFSTFLQLQREEIIVRRVPVGKAFDTIFEKYVLRKGL